MCTVLQRADGVANVRSQSALTTKGELKMNKLTRLVAIGIALALASAAVAAQTYVQGYIKADGTYVAPHYQSSPNDTVRDNYSYRGNVNPYTGQTGTDYYRSSPTSDYYQGDSTRRGNPYSTSPRSNPYSTAPRSHTDCQYSTYGC